MEPRLVLLANIRRSYSCKMTGNALAYFKVTTYGCKKSFMVDSCEGEMKYFLNFLFEFRLAGNNIQKENYFPFRIIKKRTNHQLWVFP